MEKNESKNKLANRIFYIILALLIIGSVGVTYYKIVILKDYQIVAETSCDPQSEKCFVYTDETTNEVSYYKMISKKAADIAICEATEDKIGCTDELTCTDTDASCSYTYCDPENLADGEACFE